MPKRTFRKVFKMGTTFTHVVTVANHGVIGEGSKQPWVLPKRFFSMTSIAKGKTVIVGHNTFERIKDMLDIEKCIVVSNHKDLHYPTYTLEQAVTHAATLNEEVLILGGASIFEDTWPLVDKVLMTFIDNDTCGSVKYDIDKLTGFKLDRNDKLNEFIYKQEWIRQ